MRIDLHIHSTASDGTFTPVEILAEARRLRLAAIALTDHDTVEGIRRLLADPIPEDICILSGVEISAAPPSSCPRKGSFHILGYGLDVDHPDLGPVLARLQSARQDRNPAMIQRLKALGMALDLDQVAALAGGRQSLGRPHIARAMLENGYVASLEEAFDRFLGQGRPAYVDKFRIDCAAAMGLIRSAGGLPVLAHPGISIPPEVDPAVVLDELVPLGLAGIEVYYPEHGPDQTRRYAAAARARGLLMTGGSDFHGSLKPDIHLGTGAGSLNVPFSLYQELLRALA